MLPSGQSDSFRRKDKNAICVCSISLELLLQVVFSFPVKLVEGFRCEIRHFPVASPCFGKHLGHGLILGLSTGHIHHLPAKAYPFPKEPGHFFATRSMMLIDRFVPVNE